MSDLTKIRNISIIAHIDAGKTTTTEGILFYSGLTHRYGNIDEGTTVMDFMPEERARGITIAAAAATVPWRDCLLHLIDTPGHIDFTAEVERSLRVIDGAVVIFSGVEGVEAQSEKVWRQADRYHVPKIAFINKLDRVGASFPRVLGEIRETFQAVAVPIQVPVGIESEFSTILDLISGELLRFEGDNSETVVREAIPADLQDTYEEHREAMIEALADHSDDIALLYLEGEDVPEDLLRTEIRRTAIQRHIVPVMVGSAKNRIGIQPLADAIIDFLPSPEDVGSVSGHDPKTGDEVVVSPDPEEPFAGFIFKVTASTTADLFYVRTYSGTLKQNGTLINARTKDKVRAKQILRVYANSTKMLDEVGPGDIVGVIGIRDCGIGDSLCEPRRRVAFEKIAFPDPVISMAVEPKLSKDKDRLDEVLQLLCREDQTLSTTRDEDTGQRLISGMGELHLEISLKRVAQEFNVEVRTGEPRVAYRETLRNETVEKVVFSRSIGETELFAECDVAFEPLPRGDEMFKISSSAKPGGAVSKSLIKTAEQALQDGLRTGGSHGYPLIYLSAELQRLGAAADKTSEGAVVGAVMQAIDQAITHVGTTVLEPLMRLEVLAPEDTVGEISMYLQPRRAVIHDMTNVGDVKRISCEVPLAEMFGFGKALPRLTGGRGVFTMEPCGYQALPPDIAEQMFGSH